MPTRNRRVLIYSHDTFGLGHLRRCRAIAHALVQHDPGLSVLILSGSPIIGNFDFRERVDFVRIPGVIKLQNGEYTPLKLPMDIEETVALRASIIRHTALSYAPDVFIVDKEPHGLRGEVLDTLIALKERGTQLILGLRDILDDPLLLAPEWQTKNVLPALENLYDEIWIYGLPQVSNPLEGLDLPDTYKQLLVLGQESQSMPKVLSCVADYYERIGTLATRLRGLAIYPMLILVCGLLVAALMAFLSSVLKNDIADLTDAIIGSGRSRASEFFGSSWISIFPMRGFYFRFC